MDENKKLKEIKIKALKYLQILLNISLLSFINGKKDLFKFWTEIELMKDGDAEREHSCSKLYNIDSLTDEEMNDINED